jgi:DeoR family transcriptional regulator, fructose operon transcriptional repressor
VIAAERRLALIDLLDEQDVFSVDVLARRFAVSGQTIRRDLQALEEQGLLRRTYGGAVSRSTENSAELAFHTREEANRPQKEAIARAALALIECGQTVMFDASSTVLHLARLLPLDFEGTAVVNALPIGYELSRRQNINLTFLGGSLRHTSLSFAGPLAEATLRRLFVDTAVISAKGCSAVHGFTEANPFEAQLKELVVAKSSRVIALIDSSKLGRAAMVQFAPANCARVLVTDWGADPESIDALRQCGVEVVIADLPSADLKTG